MTAVLEKVTPEGCLMEGETKRYVGARARDRADTTTVTVVIEQGARIVNQYPLPPRNDLLNHSPGGFSWGYSGSGPAQLALAILADALGDDHRSLAEHQFFKEDRLAGIWSDDWEMTARSVCDWAREREMRKVFR